MFVPDSFRQVLPRFVVLALGVGALACSPEAGAAASVEPPTGPFVVSDYYAASGAMGDGAETGHITIYTDQNCKERPEGARGRCWSFDYVAGAQLWAGVYYQYPPNNWGAQPGLPVPGDKLTKLKFKAAIKEGTDSLQFVLGGMNFPTLPADQPGITYQDKIKTELPPQPVTTEWADFEIPVSPSADGPITELIGAFAWYTKHPMGSDPATLPPKTIYIDDLVFE